MLTIEWTACTGVVHDLYLLFTMEDYMFSKIQSWISIIIYSNSKNTEQLHFKDIIKNSDGKTFDKHNS